MTSRGGEGEVIGGGSVEEAIYRRKILVSFEQGMGPQVLIPSEDVYTCIITDSDRRALRSFAIPKDPEIISLITAQWYRLDDGCGKGAEQEENEGDKEDYS